MKTIVLCSSAAFYEHVGKLADELTVMGWKAIIPQTARKMKASGNYDVDAVKTWYKDPSHFNRKTALMRDHFNEVAGSDAILVVNDEKQGVPGYIGPNALMEMGIAFHLNKPIYVLNPVAEGNPVYEEVMGMGSTILNGALNNIKEL
jgi:hypothetical protein